MTRPARPDLCDTIPSSRNTVEAPLPTPPRPPRPPRELTRRFRGPFARWPRSADAMLALVLVLFTVLLTDGPGDTMVARDLGATPLPVLVVFAIASAAMYWRRRYPLQVAGVTLLSMVVLLSNGFADTGGAVIMALYSVGRYNDAGLWGEAAAVAGGVVMVLDGLTDDLPWAEIAFAVVVAFAAWLIGRSRRVRTERAVQYLREQEADARRAVAEERTRIARELHDVVAHQVSLMTVQAAAAHAVVADDPAGARRAMGAVEETGRQALDELRHLLGVLRPDGEDSGRGPQPELADLPRLADRVRARWRRRGTRRRPCAGRPAGACPTVGVPDRPGGADQRDPSRRRRCPRPCQHDRHSQRPAGRGRAGGGGRRRRSRTADAGAG